jgi:hypothetical protein
MIPSSMGQEEMKRWGGATTCFTWFSDKCKAGVEHTHALGVGKCSLYKGDNFKIN